LQKGGGAVFCVGKGEGGLLEFQEGRVEPKGKGDPETKQKDTEDLPPHPPSLRTLKVEWNRIVALEKYTATDLQGGEPFI